MKSLLIIYKEFLKEIWFDWIRNLMRFGYLEENDKIYESKYYFYLYCFKMFGLALVFGTNLVVYNGKFNFILPF